MKSLLFFGLALKFLFTFGRRSAAKQGVFRGQRWVGRVIRVVDGDTLWVDFGQGETRVRLAHIDAPEHDQTDSHMAVAFLEQALTGEAEVVVKPIELDHFGRVVGDVYAGKSWLNYWLVRKGCAWALPRDDEREIANAQVEAQRERIGIWAHRYPTAPWEFRKRYPALQPVSALGEN